MESASAELESFRKQWQEEVTARIKGKNVAGATAGEASARKGQAHSKEPSRVLATPQSPLARQSQTHGGADDTAQLEAVSPPASASTGPALSRNNDTSSKAPISRQEPLKTALEHFEKAVEKETQGKLGDSLMYYRQAYKLDADVDAAYRKKHFPPSKSSEAKPSKPAAKNTAAPTPGAVDRSGGDGLVSISDLISSFASCRIPTEESNPEEGSVPRPCPIADIPAEVLIEVLRQLALTDFGALGRLAQVCKRLAFLVATEESVWRRLCCGPEFGFGGMHYSWACDIFGRPLDRPPVPPITFIPVPLTPAYPTYKHNMRNRPRLRFNGCYISTVNYVRPGAPSTSQVTWNSPVLIVTYYRYLRFFRDGTVFSLLTTYEPIEVVHHLTKENLRGLSTESGRGLPSDIGATPTNVLSSISRYSRRGRWRLTGCPVTTQYASPPSSAKSAAGSASPSVPAALFQHELEHGCARDRSPSAPNTSHSIESSNGQPENELIAEPECEGDVYVETEGHDSTYQFVMQFSIKSSSPPSAAGRGPARHPAKTNNKLAWKAFRSYNTQTHTWQDFRLPSSSANPSSSLGSYDHPYRPFIWSRVKSYGLC